MNWLWRWLRGLSAPVIRLDAPPEKCCGHDVSPAALMEQLDRSVHDPQRRGQIYDSVCEVCRLAVLEQFLFDKAGRAMAQVDEEFDAAAGVEMERQICGHTICVEEYARRLKLCYDAGDSDAFQRTLAEIYCADCLIEMLVVVFRMVPQITAYEWCPEWEQQLLRLQYEI